MFDSAITLEDNGRFAAVADLCQNFEAWVTGIVVPTVEQDIAPVILAEAQAEGGPVASPVPWTSPRQRRFVMMMKRTGQMASPYERTHGIALGWAFTVFGAPGQGVIVSFGNSASGFEFVEGARQQPWLRAAGWLNAAEKAPQWGETTVVMLMTALNEAWVELKPALTQSRLL